MKKLLLALAVCAVTAVPIQRPAHAAAPVAMMITLAVASGIAIAIYHATNK